MARMATSPRPPRNIVTDAYQFVNPRGRVSAVLLKIFGWFRTNNQFSESKIAIIGNQPEALLLSILFAEAGQPNCLVGHFDEAKTKRIETGGLSEARWLLGVHRKTGITTLLSSVEELSASPPSIVVLTGHAVSQKELSELERTTRALCKFLPHGATLTFTGLCRPNFTGTTLRETIEKHSGHKVGRDVHLSYVPLFWSGETLQKFREKPKLVAGIGTGAPSLAQEIFLSIFPSISTSAKLNAAEAAGLFGPIYRDVLRALEFELASLCEADDVDYSEALDLSRQSGADNLGIPNTFVVRDAIASNIAISSTSVRGSLSVVRAARRINEAGEQRVLDLVKNALALCGKRFRHSRIAILGFSGLDSPRDPKPSPPPIIQTLERRGAILSVYPGRDNRWFEAGVLSEGVRVENTPLRAASKTSCALVALERWDFGEISPQKLASEMSRPGAICDLSRVLEASNVERAGLFYTSIGRGSSGT
jgi:UDP-N-acetyl-D-mannosaminuronate dehydrogenase